MPGQDNVLRFFNRLQEEAVSPRPREPHTGRDLHPYKMKGGWPGDNYILAGNSYNMEIKIVGTEWESRRAGCIALLLQQRGNRTHCVPVREALNFEGFSDVLSSLEREWLQTLSEDAVIGPAYEPTGVRIRTAFAVWDWQPADKGTERRLVEAR